VASRDPVPWRRRDGRQRGKDEAHLFIEFYRWKAPGWHLAGRLLYVGSVYADQVPFFRILPGALGIGPGRRAFIPATPLSSRVAAPSTPGTMSLSNSLAPAQARADDASGKNDPR
jgi:hypothetical protein